MATKRQTASPETFRNITLRHEVIAPQQAHAIVTHELYERQRPLNQVYVQQYAMEQQRGNWRQGTFISFCCWNGRRYLINGQHTLQAIILSQYAQQLGVEEIPVERYEEIGDWYSKYDRVHNRTLDHTYRAAGLADAMHLNHAEVRQIGATMPLLASGFEPVTKTQNPIRMYTSSPQTRMAFVAEWAEEAALFFEIIKGAPNGICMNLRRAPVIAVGLVTLRYTGTDAHTFWHNVVWDDGLAATDPQKHLNYFLRTTELSRYAPHTYSRYLASAWCNTWDDKALKTLQPQASHLPIRLEGTPHTASGVMRYITPSGTVLHDPILYNTDEWQQQMFPPPATPAGEARP